MSKVINQTGWGRTKRSKGYCYPAENFTEIKNQSKTISGLGIGLGRSYGDSSLNSQGIYWSSENLRKVSIDVSTGIADCESGLSIGDLERCALKLGFFPPTVPGTEFVTIGGAIASNIHGKSHHTFGSFAEGLTEIKLLNSHGEVITLIPNQPEFWATVGGMGLTGLIKSAKIKLFPVETSFLKIEEKRVKSISELIKTLDCFDNRFTYTVAWVDLSGKFMGRGIVSGGNHVKLDELPKKYKTKPLISQYPKRLSVPDIFPHFFINSISVRLFNFLWFWKVKNNSFTHVRKFLHPLDSISNWNRIYGKSGFIEYQVQIPLNRPDILHDILTELQKINAYSFLGVIKKFGVCRNDFLSFASPGYTFSIDLRLSNKVANTLEKLDNKIIEVGGRVYLTKDSRLAKHSFAKMYPKHIQWLEVKRKLDPENYWQSDQGRRLGLC